MTDEELAKELGITADEVKILEPEHRDSLQNMIDVANRWNKYKTVPSNVMID